MKSDPVLQPIQTAYRCRFCGEPLRQTFVDLGLLPLCESCVSPSQLGAPESFYPLHCFVCERCFLVQSPEHVSAASTFEGHADFSSHSDSWLANSQEYVDLISSRLGLGVHSLVLEVAGNDGYLLPHFKAKGIPVLGIEPGRNVAQTVVGKSIPTIAASFGRRLARELASGGQRTDLLLGNNFLPLVPDLNDFVAGMKLLLQPDGVIIVDFSHLIRLIEGNQFDTIYHGHFSYLSFTTAERIFAAHGLVIFDVDELSTHGGSLRIYARHAENESMPVLDKVLRLKETEARWGVDSLKPYESFAEKVETARRRILQFLIQTKDSGKSVAGYGAAEKANTLLNYWGIRTDLLSYTVDRDSYKQGKFTPGTRIPIFPPERIRETRPDYLFILPWELKEEVMAQNSFIRKWGGQFVVPIPELEIY